MNSNIGIVFFNHGAFGGAQRRYTHLFRYLVNNYRGKFYYFVNYHFYYQLKKIFPELPADNIKIIDFKKNDRPELLESGSSRPWFYQGVRPDPEKIDEQTGLLRKVFWFYKNLARQYLLYKKIEKYRKSLDIKVFMGVFSGVLPLVFYLKRMPKKSAVIFSNMDSYFYEIIPNMKKLWYRKYFSFNYAIENCDYVDFLSPYILTGIRERNVKIKDENVAITSCSFTDYSGCVPGNKENFEIAFASRLEPEKNPLMYLEAVKAISQKYPEVKFHLLGEGTLVPEIEHFIRENNLGSTVNFEFNKSPTEIFAKSSVFISIQRNNNYPSQSVLEAMACGNAVIASDVGDTRFLINEKNGLIIPLNLNGLIEAIEQLISNPLRTRQLGVNARKCVLENHTIEKSAEYFLSLFERAYSKVFGT